METSPILELKRFLEFKKLVESKGVKWTTWQKLSPKAKQNVLK